MIVVGALFSLLCPEDDCCLQTGRFLYYCTWKCFLAFDACKDVMRPLKRRTMEKGSIVFLNHSDAWTSYYYETSPEGQGRADHDYIGNFHRNFTSRAPLPSRTSALQWHPFFWLLGFSRTKFFAHYELVEPLDLLLRRTSECSWSWWWRLVLLISLFEVVFNCGRGFGVIDIFR